MGKYLWLMLAFVMLFPSGYGKGLRDTLEGLVYEAEDWTEPKDAWGVNIKPVNKWNLWTTEDRVWDKRSNGGSLQSPIIKEDRKSPEEGAPMLHTRITGIPVGFYQAFLSRTARPLGYSLDGGKTWNRSLASETPLGLYEIKDGVFEIWIDDMFAHPDNKGFSYYDYIRLQPSKRPEIYEIKAFTLPDGQTQISWITSTQLPPATIVYGPENRMNMQVNEELPNMRNHAVVLGKLEDGKKYSFVIKYPGGILGGLCSKAESFVAGHRPSIKVSKKMEVPLIIEEPAAFGRKAWPVTSGVPFAQGVLASVEDIRIFDAKGNMIPATLTETSRWVDGSIRWVTCQFNGDTVPGQKSEYFLRIAPGQPKAPGKQGTSLSQESFLASPINIGLSIVLEDGTKLVPGKPVLESYESTVTRDEAVVATVYRGGKDGKEHFIFRTKTTGFKSDAGQILRVRYSLTNCDMSVEMTKVRSITAEVPVEKTGGALVLTDGKAMEGDVEFRQFLVNDGKAVFGGKETEIGKIDGVFNFDASSVYVKDFWQSYPKGFSRIGGKLYSHILPELPKANYPPEGWHDKPMEFFIHYFWFSNGCYSFKRGMEIQQELWSTSVGSREQRAGWLLNPLFAKTAPQYYCDSKAFSYLDPVSPDLFPEDWEALQKSFDNLERGRVIRGEYGWMSYGDWFGERKWNWGNNEYDLSYTLACTFARSGDLKFLARADQMARHYTTVDLQHIKSNPAQREIVYSHSTGHVGGFITKNDPLFISLGKTQASARGSQDSSGGHSHQAGNFLMASLTGNMDFFKAAELECWNQATWYTPAFRISIERSAGWVITNAVNAYNYTGNPYYLNAAKIYYEAVCATQNPKTGCFDLRQDQSECECPDKKEHRGGKAFATGVLLHGLIRLYQVTEDPQVKVSITRCADWLLDSAWNENAKGFRYKTGCPKYANSGNYSILVIEGIAAASYLTGNKRYADFLVRTLGVPLRGTTGSGKSFTQRFRQTAHATYLLRRLSNINHTDVVGLSSFTEKNGFFIDKDGKASVSISMTMKDTQPLKCSLDVVGTENLQTDRQSVSWLIEKQGQSVSPVINVKDAKEGGVLKLALTMGSLKYGMTLKAYAVPAEPELGSRVVFFGGDANFTAVAFKQLGFVPEFLPDINKADFNGCKTVVVGSDSLNVSTPALTFEGAGKLLAFANAGGKVVLMQINDDNWDADFFGEKLEMMEPDGRTGTIVQPEHPIFAGIDPAKFRGGRCYDSVARHSSKWKILAIDDAKRTCIASMKRGKGEILFILPSFDRFHIPAESMDKDTGKRFIKNIIEYCK